MWTNFWQGNSGVFSHQPKLNYNDTPNSSICTWAPANMQLDLSSAAVWRSKETSEYCCQIKSVENSIIKAEWINYNGPITASWTNEPLTNEHRQQLKDKLLILQKCNFKNLKSWHFNLIVHNSILVMYISTAIFRQFY